MKKILIAIGYATFIYALSALGVAGEYWLSNLWNLSFNGMTWVEANLHAFSNPIYMGAMILLIAGFVPYVSWKLAGTTKEIIDMKET